MKAWIFLIMLSTGGIVEEVAEADDYETAKQEIRTLYPDGNIVGRMRLV